MVVFSCSDEETVPVTWSDEKLILLYSPGRGSNSRPPAHRSFKNGKASHALNHSATAEVVRIDTDLSYLMVNHYPP